ncbi:hypothetical protein BO71DRAFT_71640 [Aspergillus ellipticus CBS 707.79]|uniref:Uncharacterized protein n=1 Tax=Aspergillus ellipticus CBS 707.79 TaxID=1448320 RepID=A0A319DL09_9EURO|nr:hypothetical protein BO71DRAFT_71640 [Aspergillus ellipticus CBS 707.79]
MDTLRPTETNITGKYKVYIEFGLFKFWYSFSSFNILTIDIMFITMVIIIAARNMLLALIVITQARITNKKPSRNARKTRNRELLLAFTRALTVLLHRNNLVSLHMIKVGQWRRLSLISSANIHIENDR